MGALRAIARQSPPGHSVFHYHSARRAVHMNRHPPQSPEQLDRETHSKTRVGVRAVCEGMARRPSYGPLCGPGGGGMVRTADPTKTGRLERKTALTEALHKKLNFVDRFGGGVEPPALGGGGKAQRAPGAQAPRPGQAALRPCHPPASRRN